MFKVSKMFIEDYEQIKDAFNEFDDFWSPENLKSELQAENREYVVVKDEEGLIVGFAGIILSVDDAEITNIVTILLLLGVFLGRVISGVHWISDIIGGVIISITLLMYFYTLYSSKSKTKRRRH